MQLNDILPPIKIDDYSNLYMIGLVLLVMMLLVYKYLNKKEKKDAKYYLRILQKCDFNDAKKTSLQFSYYGRLIFTDEITKESFLEIQKLLKEYKYTQNSKVMPKSLEKKIRDLIEVSRKQYV